MNPNFNPFNQNSQNPNFPFKNIQKTLINLQTNCSNFLKSQNPNNFINPNFNNLLNPLILKTHFENFTKQFFQTGFSKKTLPLAKISQINDNKVPRDDKSLVFSKGMSTEAIEERLAGVPVYALSNSKNEFVLVSGEKPGVSLGFFCFKEEDAKALLRHTQEMEPDMKDGSKVVAVALNKVVQLKLDGVAFRLIPELNQIKNALQETKKAGIEEDIFKGIPVFQSKSLILKNQEKRYRPVFFRKEDLEKSLMRASRQQRRMNPAHRDGDIEVAVLEDIIEGMKESTTSPWADVVFIPPGFDVSADPNHK